MEKTGIREPMLLRMRSPLTIQNSANDSYGIAISTTPLVYHEFAYSALLHALTLSLKDMPSTILTTINPP